jgi:drug/metabolite transporter (DMT)-like permease
MAPKTPLTQTRECILRCFAESDPVYAAKPCFFRGISAGKPFQARHLRLQNANRRCRTALGIQSKVEISVSSRAYLVLIIATLCWGGNAVAGKLAVGHVSPMVLTFLRWTLAVVIILAISLPQLVRDWPVVKKRLPYFFVLGAIGYTCFNAALYTALRYTSAINVAVIQAGIPMVIFALNFILFRTKIFAGQIIGFFLTIAGVSLLASHGDLMSLVQLQMNVGDAIMLLAVLMAIPAIGALVTSAPLMLWEVAKETAVWPDAKGWVIALYTALFASLIAQICFILGVERIGPNRAGLFINLIPVFGTLLSVMILGEVLHPYQIIALLLTLGGIAVAERKKPPVP